MDNWLLTQIGQDTASMATYTITVSVQNGRLTAEERQRVASTITRHAKGMIVQMEMAVPDKSAVYLRRNTSALGTTDIDLEAPNAP